MGVCLIEVASHCEEFNHWSIFVFNIQIPNTEIRLLFLYRLIRTKKKSDHRLEIHKARLYA